jgi:hypothetical protein
VYEAIAEVRRYTKALSPEGLVAISMMNDGKSRAIWRGLRQEFRWIDGILWQQTEPWPSYRIRANREHPGYLVGVIGLRQSSEGPVDRELALDRRADQEGAHHEKLPGARFGKRTGSNSPTPLTSRSI